MKITWVDRKGFLISVSRKSIIETVPNVGTIFAFFENFFLTATNTTALKIKKNSIWPIFFQLDKESLLLASMFIQSEKVQYLEIHVAKSEPHGLELMPLGGVAY